MYTSESLRFYRNVSGETEISEEHPGSDLNP